MAGTMCYCDMVMGEPWGDDSEFAVSKLAAQRCLHLEHLSDLFLSSSWTPTSSAWKESKYCHSRFGQVQGRLGMTQLVLEAERSQQQPAPPG